MKKMPLPVSKPMEIFTSCVSHMRTGALKAKLEAGTLGYKRLAKDYKQYGNAGKLSDIPHLEPNEDTTIVTLNVTKAEFINLYENHLVKKSKPSRQFYDALLLSANDKCPFCGGIGTPRNLDHYLPKAHFPQFSILPYNLIPACLDCNMGEKGAGFATQRTDQVIHPYLDKDCFFNEQWIKARVIEGDEVTVDFVVDAPVAWSDIDRSRVETHFSAFGLADRYRIEAAVEITIIIDQRNGFMKSWSLEYFKDFLLSTATNCSLPVNHWKKVLYQALARSDWFCDYDFRINAE